MSLKFGPNIRARAPSTSSKAEFLSKGTSHSLSLSMIVLDRQMFYAMFMKVFRELVFLLKIAQAGRQAWDLLAFINFLSTKDHSASLRQLYCFYVGL